MRIALGIEYDGSRFLGWQTQPGGGGAQDALDADSPNAFLQALAALAPEFQNLLDQIRTTVTDLENANVAEDAKTELQQAFANAESCQALESEG